MADESNVNTGTAAGTRTYDDFRMSGYKFLTRTFTVLSGQSISAREVCAKQVTAGKIVTYEKGATESGTAYCIAVEDVDATSGDTIGTFYTMGVFNKNKLTITDTGITADDESMYDDLRTVGIHLVDQAAG